MRKKIYAVFLLSAILLLFFGNKLNVVYGASKDYSSNSYVNTSNETSDNSSDD